MMLELTTEQRAAWRDELIAVVETPPGRRHRRMPVLAPALAVTVAAAAVLGFPSPPQAPRMLTAAAQITRADPVPGPGEYLRVRVRAEYMAMDGDGNGYLSPEVRETFVAAGPDRTAIRRTTLTRPTEFFGAGGAALAARDWTATPVTVETVELTPADTTLPTDPQRLLDRLRATANPAGLPTGQHLFDQLGDLLKQETVTAGRRAAAYRALALVPGIVVAEDTVVLDGATGTAFALQSNRDDQIVIEPDTGRFVGSRLVLTEDYGVMPAGAVLESTAVTVDVVDAAPTPAGAAPPITQLPR